ncbi:hypothetical protein JWH04_12430 [Xanthomonas melonis]|uniref:reprolysin-like metallopeptidase n=1 Tax=Xanthomonas melonis TaxID=56456 RepID=UPI001E43F6BE|nr:M12 family metallo-peptidase [Xanthomonas melonis]MCD0279734.1 hypothetical protein [Xanthomonas melonis]
MQWKITGAALALCAVFAGCSKQADDAKPAASHVNAAITQSARKAAGSAAAFLPMKTAAAQSMASAAPESLVRYDDTVAPIHKIDGVWHKVTLDENAALTSRTSGTLSIPLPDGTAMTLVHRKSSDYPDGNWTWVGNTGNQQAVITFGPQATFGRIMGDGRRPTLRIHSDGKDTWVIEEDPTTDFTADETHRDDAILPPQQHLLQIASAKSAAAKSANASPAAKGNAVAMDLAANTAIIDLLVGYNDGFVTTYGNESAAQTRVRQLIALANAAFDNSHINAQIRLTRAVRVFYPLQNTNSDALYALATGATLLAEFKRMRDTYGADLVTLLRPFSVSQGGCGVAYVIGSNLTPVTQASDDLGFSVVSDGVDAGGSSYCLDRTLAHEIGHNLGSAHDIENSSFPGAFPYSYGYKTDSANGNFYTIMAYGNPGQLEAPGFSDPTALCNGIACGSSAADNVRSMRQTVSTIAGFRSPKSIFNDVATNYWALDSITRLYNAGITGGCNSSPLQFCPTSEITRDQTAVFLLRSAYGRDFAPSGATGIFADVPANFWAANWIERLAADGVASGCSAAPLQFCPLRKLTRAEMAVLVLRAKYGRNYQPPPATGIFADVATTYWSAAWIEAFSREGITGGCETNPRQYCPERTVTREEMAVFLARAFNL